MKKATDTYALVIVGSELIYKIQKFGNSFVVDLKLEEYCALLAYAYPYGSVNKARNRTAGLEKARELESVRYELRMYVAVAPSHMFFFLLTWCLRQPPKISRGSK